MEHKKDITSERKQHIVKLLCDEKPWFENRKNLNKDPRTVKKEIVNISRIITKKLALK